jgi:hypothetical protein
MATVFNTANASWDRGRDGLEFVAYNLRDVEGQSPNRDGLKLYTNK